MFKWYILQWNSNHVLLLHLLIIFSSLNLKKNFNPLTKSSAAITLERIFHFALLETNESLLWHRQLFANPLAILTSYRVVSPTPPELTHETSTTLTRCWNHLLPAALLPLARSLPPHPHSHRTLLTHTPSLYAHICGAISPKAAIIRPKPRNGRNKGEHPHYVVLLSHLIKLW